VRRHLQLVSAIALAPSLIIALIIGWAGGSARAGEPPARGLTLAEARALGARVGPDVVLAQRREAMARAQVDAAGALGNPSVTLQSARLSARFFAAVSVPVPLFGQRGAAVAAARSDADTAVVEIEALRVEARWNVTHAWLDLWEAQQRGRLLQTASDEAARLASIAEQRFAAGSTARLDVVRTGADRARARAEALAAGSMVAAASARLAAWLGPGDANADANTREGPLRAVGAPDVGALPAEETALERLLARHPALDRDRAAAAASAARVRFEQRQRWPIVSAQLAVAEGDPTLPGTDVIGGVTFDAPVLSLRRGAIARAQAEEALARTTTDIDARRLGAQLGDAYQQARAATLRAQALETEVLPALEEARRMTEEAYRDGRVDLLRVLEAQRALYDGRVATVEARAAVERALADVERALGAPLQPATQPATQPVMEGGGAHAP
jgi:cobalt-zinc-cadmium efflux system outer membrane protein